MKISALTLVAEASGGTPGAPVNVRYGLVLSSPKAVRIMWDPPANTGGSAIIGYQIEKATRDNEEGVRVIETNSTATTYDDRSLSEDGITGTSIDKDGTFYFYKVIAINSQGAGVASALLTARWTHHPRPSVTVHTRAARPGTATAAITNGATDSTWVVTWVDGAAATRQCHTDYTLIFGYRTSATGTVYTYEFPPPTVTVDSPAIVISKSVENPDHRRPVPSNRHGDFKLRLGSLDGG